VFDDVCSWGPLKASAADGLCLVPRLQIWVFSDFSPCGVCFGFSVDAFVWSQVLCIFLLLFSAPGRGVRVLHQGFFSHSSHRLDDGWTGWRFVAALSIADPCYFCTCCLGLRPQLETKFII